MDAYSISLPPLAPAAADPVMFQALNDIYIQLWNLVEQLNRFDGIVRSPDGHLWKVTVSNTGALSATPA